MGDSVKLSAFPASSAQALTMVYLNTLDLSGKSPEEIVHIYSDAYDRICTEQQKISDKESADGFSVQIY